MPKDNKNKEAFIPTHNAKQLCNSKLLESDLFNSSP